MKLPFETTYTYSDILTEKRVIAVAHPNGVLNPLVQASNSILDANIAQLTDEEFLARHAYYGLFGETGCVDEASIAFNELIEQVAPMVTVHVAHARSVVQPLVLKLAEEYLAYLERAKPKDPSEDFEITQVKVPEILTDTNFISEFDFARSMQRRTPGMYLNLPFRDSAAIAELITIGNSRQDKLLAEWIHSKDTSFLESIWINVFGDGAQKGIEGVGGYEMSFALSEHEKAEIGLAIYLIARKLQIEIPEEINLTKAKFDELITSIKDMAAVDVISNINRVAEYNSTNTLVIRSKEYNYQLVVNGDLYPQWLESGGTPELLLGMLVSGDVRKTIPEITEKTTIYQREWDNYCVLYSAKETNKKHTYARETLKTIFAQHMNLKVPEEREVREKESNFNITRCKTASDYIDCLTVTQLDDVFPLALYLVAKIRFDYTSAYSILSDIQAAVKINPNIDMREAATLAVTNYIGDFLADQIALKEI